MHIVGSPSESHWTCTLFTLLQYNRDKWTIIINIIFTTGAFFRFCSSLERRALVTRAVILFHKGFIKNGKQATARQTWAQIRKYACSWEVWGGLLTLSHMIGNRIIAAFDRTLPHLSNDFLIDVFSIYFITNLSDNSQLVFESYFNIIILTLEQGFLCGRRRRGLLLGREQGDLGLLLPVDSGVSDENSKHGSLIMNALLSDFASDASGKLLALLLWRSYVSQVAQTHVVPLQIQFSFWAKYIIIYTNPLRLPTNHT